MWLYGDMIIRLMSPQLFLKWVSISDFLFQFLSPWEMSNFISAQMSPPPLPRLQTHSCCSSLQNTSHTLSWTDRVCVWQTLMIEFHTSQWLLRVALSPSSPPGVCCVNVWIFLTICGEPGWRFMWWKKWQMMGIGQIRLLDKKLFLKRFIVSSLSW